MARSHNEALRGLMKKFPGKILGAALIPSRIFPERSRKWNGPRSNGFCSVVLDKVYPVKDHPYSEPLGSHRELWPFFKGPKSWDANLSANVQHGHRISNIAAFNATGFISSRRKRAR